MRTYFVLATGVLICFALGDSLGAAVTTHHVGPTHHDPFPHGALPHDPHHNDPTHHVDPAHHEPTHHDPHDIDPHHIDPAHHDPHHTDPSHHDPAHHDPTHHDPHHIDPHHHAGDVHSLTAPLHFVDQGDLHVWSTGFGLHGFATHMQGDSDGDLDVDGADFLGWQQQLGSAISTADAVASIPEPNSFILAAGAMGFGLFARRLPMRF